MSKKKLRHPAKPKAQETTQHAGDTPDRKGVGQSLEESRKDGLSGVDERNEAESNEITEISETNETNEEIKTNEINEDANEKIIEEIDESKTESEKTEAANSETKVNDKESINDSETKESIKTDSIKTDSTNSETRKSTNADSVEIENESEKKEASKKSDDLSEKKSENEASSKRSDDLSEKKSEKKEATKRSDDLFEKKSDPKPDKEPRKRLTLQERLALAARGKKNDSAPGSTISSPGGSTTNLNEMSRSVTPEKEPVESLRTDLRVKSLSAELEKARGEKEKLAQSLQAQESLISDLRREGEVLSKRELKLNESIKKLKQTNAALESMVQKLDTTVEDNAEVESLMKQRGFSSINDMCEKYDSLLAEHEQSVQWEARYSDSRALYEQEVSEKRKALRDLADIKVSFDVAKKQHALELQGKNSTIADLRQDLQRVKHESLDEVSRLETKIEQLRADREVSSADMGGSSQELQAAYSRLSENHNQLHQQHLSAQENWKVIEASLSAKIDALTQSVESLKRSRGKLSEEIKMREKDLRQERNVIGRLEDESDKWKRLEHELRDAIANKESEMVVLHERFDKIKAVYDTERNNLREKVRELEEKVAQLEEKLAELDEAELTDMEKELTEESMENYEALSDFAPSSSSYSQPSNVQLVNKMSANIRRLEVELNTIREEKEQVLRSKEETDKALLVKIREVAVVDDLRRELEGVRRELEERRDKESSLLELIGEKSEQVEELRADVGDLKDLCRLQVQQMIEIQERTKSN